jgi:subtilisin family serine protease
MVANKHESITKAVDALHGPVEQLMLALQANDCLVVAAAGNDSVYRGIPRRPRWNPRIPAVYASVLGVAADTIRPSVPAVYSNRGELPHETGADVATLGGDLASDGVHPTGGMISVYTAATFPPLLPPAPPTVNTSGWGEWAGTSFAAPIVTGIAANLWMTDPGASAASILAEINARVRAHTPLQPDLGVPGIPLRLTWLP